MACPRCRARDPRDCTCRARRTWRGSVPRSPELPGSGMRWLDWCRRGPALPMEKPRLRCAFGVVGFRAVLIEQEQPQLDAVEQLLRDRPSPPGAPSRLRSARAVAASTNPGIFAIDLRMMSTCSAVIAPWAAAAAVAGSTGSRGSPVSERRGPNTAASARRRLASRVESRHRIVSTSRQDLAPNALAVVSTCNRANNRWTWVGS